MGVKKDSGSLLAQSIAARQRRRKITEKTQELGKLVPGGQKMNTAEMLQAAYKYIKFLQAQVWILDLLNSSYTHPQDEEDEELEGEEEEEEEEEEDKVEEVQNLIESTLIQEKLYTAEICLVPLKLLEELRNDDPALVPLMVKQEHST